MFAVRSTTNLPSRLQHFVLPDAEGYGSRRVHRPLILFVSHHAAFPALTAGVNITQVSNLEKGAGYPGLDHRQPRHGAGGRTGGSANREWRRAANRAGYRRAAGGARTGTMSTVAGLLALAAQLYRAAKRLSRND